MHALGDLVSAKLVVEAIVEDLEVKRRLLRDLEVVVAPATILASNTSSLSITALAAGMKHPGRVVGMHFFNPAPVMPLVEVVSGLATDAAAADVVYATAAAWGKKPVHAKSTPGFIVNRCARPFYAEALRLLTERAADPATIDAVMREAGAFRMGPFELMDLIGHDVNLAVTKSVWEAYFHDPRYRPSVLQQERVAAGFLGRKSGRRHLRPWRECRKAAAADGRRAAATDADRRRGRAPHGHRLARSRGRGRIRDRRCRADRRAGVRSPRRGRCAARPLRRAHGDGHRIAPADGATSSCSTSRHDYGRCTRLAIAAADGCGDAAPEAVVGALQAAGIAVSRIDDVAGLVVMRTVAMLANEAADAVTQGIASARDVDLAMRNGVNYPRGPLAWADAIGLARVARGAAQSRRALRRRSIPHVAADRAPLRDRRPARGLNQATPTCTRTDFADARGGAGARRARRRGHVRARPRVAGRWACGSCASRPARRNSR